MPTIKDIATRAGVSTCTVSRYLNDKIKVKEETAKQIDQAIMELNYHKNYNAVFLKTKKSNTVALIIPSLKNVFFAEIAESISSILKKEGYTLVTYTTENNYEEEKKASIQLIENRAAGAIFITLPGKFSDSKHIEYIEDEGIKTVMLNRYFEPCEFSCVSTDMVKGAEEATDFFLTNGGTKVALIVGYVGQPQSEAYVAGYLNSLKKHGKPVDQELICFCNYEDEEITKKTEELINLGVDSILSISDYDALTSIEAIKKKGLRIPEDVQIIGSGNTAFSKLVSMTSIDTNAEALGTLGAQVLLQRVKSGNSDNKFVMVDPNLVKRSSTRQKK